MSLFLPLLAAIKLLPPLLILLLLLLHPLLLLLQLLLLFSFGCFVIVFCRFIAASLSCCVLRLWIPASFVVSLLLLLALQLPLASLLPPLPLLPQLLLARHCRRCCRRRHCEAVDNTRRHCEAMDNIWY